MFYLLNTIFSFTTELLCSIWLLQHDYYDKTKYKMFQAVRIVEKFTEQHKNKNGKVQFVLEYTHFTNTLLALTVTSADLVPTVIVTRTDYCVYRFSELVLVLAVFLLACAGN
jgi:hypothetical protein